MTKWWLTSSDYRLAVVFFSLKLRLILVFIAWNSFCFLHTKVMSYISLEYLIISYRNSSHTRDVTPVIFILKNFFSIRTLPSPSVSFTKQENIQRQHTLIIIHPRNPDRCGAISETLASVDAAILFIIYSDLSGRFRKGMLFLEIETTPNIF